MSAYPRVHPAELFRGAKDALLIVDLQQDFLPGGTLAVPDGDAVIPPLNRCIAAASRAGSPIYASRDWHPPDHCSFLERGGPWAVHCVAGSPGAGFAPELSLPEQATIIDKATSADAEAYSAFDGTDLAAKLHGARVSRLVVGGLATDYCVKASVLDALRSGFEVVVVADAIRAIEAERGDARLAGDEMTARGARFVALAGL